MNQASTGFFAFLLAAVVGVGVHQFVFNGGNLQSTLVRQETHLPRLDVLTETLRQLANSSEAHGDPLVSSRVAGLLEKLDIATARLEQDESCDEAELANALNSILIARYSGVIIDRSRFLEPFENFAQHLISQYPQSPLARNAEMLQLLGRHDFHEPVGRDLIADIVRFAANHTPEQGADLYCLIAVELVRNQQPDAANAILKQGIKAYQSSPLAVSRLVNRSADLALSKPPPPSYTQTQFDAMMKTYEGLVPCQTRS